MRRAIALSLDAVRSGGGPFGAVVVRDGRIVGEGANHVTTGNDPTAHAEVVAIRRACAALGTFELRGAEIYTSCEPCPMCLGAIYWARLDHIHYANDRDAAAAIGFDDAFLYREVSRAPHERSLPISQLLPDEGAIAFREWDEMADKVRY